MRVCGDRRDHGEVMQMTVVFIAGVMVAVWTMISAGEALNARRQATRVAAAAARAGAQPSGVAEIPDGVVELDPSLARSRVGDVVGSSGAWSAQVDPGEVTVTVTVSAQYTFPSLFPSTASATESATAYDGVETGG